MLATYIILINTRTSLFHNIHIVYTTVYYHSYNSVVRPHIGHVLIQTNNSMDSTERSRNAWRDTRDATSHVYFTLYNLRRKRGTTKKKEE